MDLKKTLPPLMLGGSMWALRPDAFPRVLELARQAADLRTPLAFDFDDDLDLEDQPPAGQPGVAIIPLTGVLTPHGSLLSFLFGGSSRGVQGFRDQIAAAVANPDIAAIVLDIDSPGGSVGLVPEAAADVRAAREAKPVIAVANTLAASGAYYIGSQASEFFVTPSGQVGSIGVYYLHEDWSRANDRMGLAVTYVSAGKYKTEGNPDEPLSDEARAAWQDDANALYEEFLADVAAGRGVSVDDVRNGYGEGRVLLARDALEAGMVDGVETLQTIVGRTVEQARSSTGASARRIGRAAVVVPAPRTEAPAGDPAEPTEPEPVEPTDPVAPASDPAPEASADEPAEDDPTPEPEPEAVDEPAEEAGADEPHDPINDEVALQLGA